MDLQFGQYQLKRAQRQLQGPSGLVELSARSFDILTLLLGKPDEVVGKNELFEAVWPGQIVEENTLQVHMSALRKALDVGMITTVHGRGYKYAGPRPLENETQSVVPQPMVSARKPMVVVMPFDNLGGDPDQQFFSDGMTGDITDRLARFGAFAVIGQHSAASFRATAPDVAAIREKLKVDFIITGSVRRAGDRIRFAVRLSDAASGEAIWGERYDRPIGDLFTLQDEISQLVAAAIARHLEVEINVRSIGRPPASLSSYEHLLQGYWHFKKFTLAGVAAARQCFEQAIALDPRNAGALGWLGVIHCEYWMLDFNMESAAKGVEFTAQAISIDPTNASCHAMHNWALLCVGDLASALRVSERGISLNPDDPNVLVHRALSLGYDGRTSEAKDLISQAHRLEPIPPLWFAEFSGIVAFSEGRYEDTLAGTEPVTEPAWDMMYMLACYGLMGEKLKARAVLERLAAAGRNPDWALGISLEPYRDPAIRQRLSEGLAKALLF
jgi:TolB-like protein